MEKKQYYSALKTLEQLEHMFLPHVKGSVGGGGGGGGGGGEYHIFTILECLCTYCRYTFSDLLGKEIPRLRKSIQDQSTAELTVSPVDWVVVGQDRAITTLLPRLYIPWHRREKLRVCCADEG